MLLGLPLDTSPPYPTSHLPYIQSKFRAFDDMFRPSISFKMPDQETELGLNLGAKRIAYPNKIMSSFRLIQCDADFFTWAWYCHHCTRDHTKSAVRTDNPWYPWKLCASQGPWRVRLAAGGFNRVCWTPQIDSPNFIPICIPSAELRFREPETDKIKAGKTLGFDPHPT